MCDNPGNISVFNVVANEIDIDKFIQDKRTLFVILFVTLLLVSSGLIVTLGVAYLRTGESILGVTISNDRSAVIEEAYLVYERYKQEGLDFSNGTCLSNELIQDWVLDIVHDPKTEVDDRPDNQCRDYILGVAHHFVELNPEGNLIRAE